MTYKKRFSSNTNGQLSPISGANRSNQSAYSNSDFGYKNYQNRLPEVYTGHPNRVERYNQYEAMDIDPEISACLDIISEFSTQKNDHNGTPFNIKYKEDPTPHEVELITKQLQQWTKLNEFDTRTFKIFRNTLKYGDQVFIRDPETFKLFWSDMTKVSKVIVNESEGKLPEQYVIKDINPNLQNLTIAEKTSLDFAATPATAGFNSPTNYTAPNGDSASSGSRFSLGLNEAAIDANHILHLSLTEGLDRYWPFGQSILESVYKVYKQKELLEDAILIYRVQRAPERRVFKIDVGNMPSHLAMAFVDRIKNEVHQRRIPSSQGGQSILDATYSPLSMNEDYYFPHNCITLDTKIPLLDGRTLSLNQIIGEYSSGKDLWVYSVNQQTFAMEPGKISWAGVTRKNAELLEVELDNGEKLRVTPDHRFIMRDGSEKCAIDLVELDSLMPLYLINSKTSSKQKGNPYLRYIDNASGKKKWVHTTVCPKIGGGKTHVIHHIDCNPTNNNPDNLIEMTNEDHNELHRNLGSYSLSKQWGSAEGRSKLINGMRSYHDNRTEDQINECKERNRRNAKSWHTNASSEAKELWKLRRTTAATKNIEYVYTSAMLDRAMQFAKINVESIGKLSDLVKLIINDSEFMELWKSANIQYIGISKNVDRVLASFNCDRMRVLFSMGEFKTWGSYAQSIGVKHDHTTNSKINKQLLLDNIEKFNLSPDKCSHCGISMKYEQRGRKYCSHQCYTESNKLINKDRKNTDPFYNHKVAKVTVLSYREDTGDITVEGNHNFATAAGVYLHNSDGKGSSVEVLPGGQNLGEISDLKYFSVRLARGLRVPSSYLPSGQEESTAAFNDGRVGTAMIQEHRFNQYCERLQKYVSQKLDTEFKLFLRWRGFNIDSGLFDVEFNAPQNFAAYRQSELDTTRVGVFAQMEGFSYISKRFALQRFLGLTEEEVAENERMWHEENADDEDSEVKGSDLRSIGISAGDLDSDLSSAESLDMEQPSDTEPAEIGEPMAQGPEATPPPPPTA